MGILGQFDTKIIHKNWILDEFCQYSLSEFLSLKCLKTPKSKNIPGANNVPVGKMSEFVYYSKVLCYLLLLYAKLPLHAIKIYWN